MTSSPSSSTHSDPPHPRPPPSRSPSYLDPFQSEPDESCYTELYPSIHRYVERPRAHPQPPSVLSLTTNVCLSPLVHTVAGFKPATYRSALMPRDNKPLERRVLQRVKDLLEDVDPRTAAQHMTKADCTVARILEVSPEEQSMMGVSSGMELLTLPHGDQLRRNLLERFETMSILLAVQLLGCTGSQEQRAALLHKTIQIAAELKTNMGNMFGFATVMRALDLPQVSRLEQTWMTLRQRHTEGAVLYEKTLRPFMKSMSNGKESSSLSNTTVPHVVPLLSLLEVGPAEGGGGADTDVEMDVVMFHLGAGRTIAQLGGIFQSNAENKLQGFQEDPEVLELFLTDFQMRLLWGYRGAEENQTQRYAKYHQVLNALSNHLEPAAGPL